MWAFSVVQPSSLSSHMDVLESFREGAMLPALAARLLRVAEVPGLTKKPILKAQKVARAR